MKIRALVWGENIHERSNASVRDIYPQGIHSTIAGALNASDLIDADITTLQEHEHGLTQDVLDATDVLLWWGHAAHGDVADEIVERVLTRVWEGMGLVVLHSAHFSKVFKRLMGTPCSLTWREAGERERLWVVNRAHPITTGIDGHFELPQSEMYGEPFVVPEPMETVLMSWFEGGEVFRSGMTWQRGAGRVFYFGPGHETYPIYHNPVVQKILTNAVVWASQSGCVWKDVELAPNRAIENALEPLTANGPKLHSDGEAGFK